MPDSFRAVFVIMEEEEGQDEEPEALPIRDHDSLLMSVEDTQKKKRRPRCFPFCCCK